jgi:alkanesulfonate monooxygenase SsuD/methylene tetrahydromethanopterin reductase-like flavin-dependent oxidoreductase (luciferase family)
MELGVTLPQIKRTWAEARAAATEFERLGFDSVWVCDHLYGVPVPENPILEAWSELAAVAAVTDRVRLGTLVTPPLFRYPAVLAKQVATIDHIGGGGRVICGLGAGWYQDEFEGYGCPFPSLAERMTALDETAELLARMWTEDEVTYEGRWATARGVRCEPRPEQRPRILIGGSGERRLMDIAARRADIWNNLAVTQGELGHKVEVLHRRCEEVGRDPATIQVSQQCNVVIAPDEPAAREHLAKAKVIYGGHMGGALEEHGIWGSPAMVVDKIGRHAELGCDHLVIEFFGRDTREPAGLFAAEVMPHL